MLIYLDTCCFNRPFDDQSIDRNRIEAEAVLTILRRVHRGTLDLAGSEANDLEVSMMRDSEKRGYVKGLMQMRCTRIMIDDAIKARSTELISLGFTPLDALHVACAEASRCAAMLTTDDAMIRLAARHFDRLKTRVRNPLDWLREDISHD